MEKELITYDLIYEVLRKEKYRNELQKLDKDFYKNVTNYLKEKKEILDDSNQDSIFSGEVQKTRKQLENTMKMIKELYERREGKILQIALLSSRSNSNEEIENVLEEEKELFNVLKNNLSKYRSGIIEKVLICKEPCIAVSDLKGEENKVVRFIKPVPQFVGEDLNVYGPFEEDNVVNIPSKTAKILIENKRVEEI